MGDVLYDELPEKGFECRDEQIFMAYQIEQALKEKMFSLQRQEWELAKPLLIYYQPFPMRVTLGNQRSLLAQMKH